jgi:putative PIN family toxin of toxin-antitoxin system
MTHVVIDTNVLVSALLTPKGTAAAALHHALTGQWQICYNAVINAEYQDVLSRPKLHINAVDSASLLNRLLSKALCVTPIPSTVPMVDEDDRIFYDTAIHAAAFLVTGNKRHYPIDPHILNPAEFLHLSGSYPS